MFAIVFLTKSFNSDMDTLTHLLKASLGTGILAMPMAFSYAGLVTGIFATILTAIICTHVSSQLIYELQFILIIRSTTVRVCSR